jgi:hypothetical protein
MDLISLFTKIFVVKNAMKGLIIEPLKKFNLYLDEHDYADVKELSHFFRKG